MTMQAEYVETAGGRVNDELFTHAFARKLASQRGWWMTDNFTDEPGRINVDLFPTGQLRSPNLRRIARVLPMPQAPDEVIAVRNMPDCAVPEVIISYEGLLGATLSLLVDKLPNLNR